MTTPPSDPRPADDARPDADAFACPLCGYDLRGLPEHRCPECGHAFDPVELRATRDGHWSDFEHASRRVLLAFLLTAARSLMPWRFWKSPGLAIRPNARRLRQWRIAWSIQVAVIAIGNVIADTIDYSGTWARAFSISYHFGISTPHALLLLILLLWPSTTTFAIGLFGDRNDKLVSSGLHRRRCGLYALPTVLLAAAVAPLASLSPRVAFLFVARPTDPAAVLESLGFNTWVILALLGAFIASTVHLAIAHHVYLRVRHAVAQAILVQLVSWGMIVTTIAFLPGH